MKTKAINIIVSLLASVLFIIFFSNFLGWIAEQIYSLPSAFEITSEMQFYALWSMSMWIVLALVLGFWIGYFLSIWRLRRE